MAKIIVEPDYEDYIDYYDTIAEDLRALLALSSVR